MLWFCLYLSCSGSVRFLNLKLTSFTTLGHISANPSTIFLPHFLSLVLQEFQCVRCLMACDAQVIEPLSTILQLFFSVLKIGHYLLAHLQVHDSPAISNVLLNPFILLFILLLNYRISVWFIFIFLIFNIFYLF